MAQLYFQAADFGVFGLQHEEAFFHVGGENSATWQVGIGSPVAKVAPTREG